MALASLQFKSVELGKLVHQGGPSVWRNKTTAAAILFLLACRISQAQGIHLNVDDSYEPQYPVDYPFVYPLTGLLGRDSWVMSCATSIDCNDNGVRVCGEGETNFGVTSHVGCPRHHTG